MSSFASFNLTIGVLFSGLIVTGCIFGITISQAAWYFIHYPRDRRSLKYMVSFVCFLDTLSLALNAASMWQYIVVKQSVFNGRPVPWQANAQIVVNALSVGVIESFYLFRIWTLSKNWWLTGFLCALIAGDVSLAFLVFVKAMQAVNVDDFSSLTGYDIAMTTTTTAADALLCFTLVTLLARSQKGSSGANRLIRRLLFYTINTGLLTTVCSILTVITVLVAPAASFYVMFYYIGSRMYTVSLLSTLNARESLRSKEEFQTIEHVSSGHSMGPRTVRRAIVEALSKVSHPANRDIVVEIQRDTTVTFEEEDRAAKRVYRKGQYRYGKPSAANPTNKAESPGSENMTVNEDSKVSSDQSFRAL